MTTYNLDRVPEHSEPCFAFRRISIAIEAEVRCLVSAALDEPELDEALWLASTFIVSEFRDLAAGRRPLSDLGDLLRSALTAEASEGGLRAAVAWIWVDALRTAGLCPDHHDFAFSDWSPRTDPGSNLSNLIHVDFRATRDTARLSGRNSIRHPTSWDTDRAWQEVVRPDFGHLRPSDGSHRRTSVTSVTNSVTPTDTGTDGDGDPPPSAPTPALLLPLAA
jgi:hypothetical protein